MSSSREPWRAHGTIWHIWQNRIHFTLTSSLDECLTPPTGDGVRQKRLAAALQDLPVISQTDSPAESLLATPTPLPPPPPPHPSATTSTEQDRGDPGRMPFLPLSLLLKKFSFFTCSCNTASVLFPAKNEDKRHSSETKSNKFLPADTGENFIKHLWPQLGGKDRILWVMLCSSPPGPPTTPSAFSYSRFLYSACASVPHSQGQGVNSSNDLHPLFSWGYLESHCFKATQNINLASNLFLKLIESRRGTGNHQIISVSFWIQSISISS